MHSLVSFFHFLRQELAVLAYTQHLNRVGRSSYFRSVVLGTCSVRRKFTALVCAGSKETLSKCLRGAHLVSLTGREANIDNTGTKPIGKFTDARVGVSCHQSYRFKFIHCGQLLALKKSVSLLEHSTFHLQPFRSTRR